MITPQTVTTPVARHMMRHKNPITHLTPSNFATYLLNYASSFVTKNSRSLRNPVPLHNIATANAACHDLHEDFVIPDFRLRHFLYSYVIVVVVNGCEHTGSPETLKPQAVPAFTFSKRFCASFGV
jgi:hypothetical protein